MTSEDDDEVFDPRGDEDDDDPLEPDVADVVEHLRDTLTHDMALRFIKNRFGEQPKDDKHLEQLMEGLIAEAYNDGYDSWDGYPY